MKQLFEELTWSNARNIILKSCGKELVDIIDEISPDDRFKLIKFQFPYGTKIVEDGVMRFPIDQDTLLPVTDSRLPDFIKKNLCYLTVPLGIITKNIFEIYHECGDKLFSLYVINHGLQLGIWEFFGASTPYSITSGARSAYMIPRISITTLHNNLKKKYNITSTVPTRLIDQWNVFKELANSKTFNKNWNTEILVLNKEWFEELNKKNPSKGWLRLKNHLYQRSWDHTNVARKKLLTDFYWQAIVKNFGGKKRKCNPYVIDTLKHLLFIIIGALPASMPFDGDESYGPFNRIQEIYENDYGVEYIPTIMLPTYLSFDNKLPVYYSIQTPTLLNTTLKSKYVTSNMDDLRDLKDLVNDFVKESANISIKINNVFIRDMLNKVHFNFYHIDRFAYGGIINPTSSLPESDKRFLYDGIEGNNNKFAANGTFIRGCVKISID